MNRIQRLVRLPVADAELEGELAVPADANGIVLFAHESGRHSPRNEAVAERLREAGFATLLFDLLTESEGLLRRNRFDIPLLTEQLVDATRWIESQSETSDLPIGYFGTETGAAAAIRAAGRADLGVGGVVFGGDCIYLAGEEARTVTAPCLFVDRGGTADDSDGDTETGAGTAERRARNEAMLSELPSQTRRATVDDGAGPAVVADLAVEWFVDTRDSPEQGGESDENGPDDDASADQHGRTADGVGDGGGDGDGDEAENDDGYDASAGEGAGESLADRRRVGLSLGALRAGEVLVDVDGLAVGLGFDRHLDGPFLGPVPGGDFERARDRGVDVLDADGDRLGGFALDEQVAVGVDTSDRGQRFVGADVDVDGFTVVAEFDRERF